jgi:hypothetical protein
MAKKLNKHESPSPIPICWKLSALVKAHTGVPSFRVPLTSTTTLSLMALDMVPGKTFGELGLSDK